jgi:hypothetical protein
VHIIGELDWLKNEVLALKTAINELAVTLIPVRCVNDAPVGGPCTCSPPNRSKTSTEIAEMASEIRNLREDIQYLTGDLDLPKTEV